MGFATGLIRRSMKERENLGTPLAVQWLTLCFHYWAPGFDPWLGN